MLDRINELIRSQAKAKKIYIFFASFAMTLVVMSGIFDNAHIGDTALTAMDAQYDTQPAAADTQKKIQNVSASQEPLSNDHPSSKIESNMEKHYNSVKLTEAFTSGEQEDDVVIPGTAYAATASTKLKQISDDEIIPPDEDNEASDDKDKALTENETETKKKKAKAKESNSTDMTAKNGGFVYSEDIPISLELQEYTYQKCVERSLEYELVLAIMWRESRFNVDAVNVNSNGTTDNGIMQINDVNRKWLRDNYGINDLMDPYQNIDAGTAMLAHLTGKYGQHNALMAYQYGEGGMARKLRQGQTTSHAVELAYSQRDYYRSSFKQLLPAPL